MPTLGQIIASITPPKRAVSRRRRWTRRIVRLLIAMSIPFLYQLWDRAHARALLDSRIASIRARAEPVVPGDLHHRDLPEARNAAKLLHEAADAIQINQEERLRMDAMTEGKADGGSAEDVEFASELMRRNQAVLERVSAAHRIKDCDWQIQWNHPALKTDLPHLRQLRELANVLADAAWVDHRTGLDSVAMRRLSDLLYLSRVADDPGPMVSHLVSIGIGAMTSYRAREMGLGLRLETAEARQEAAALLREFLDEDARRAGIIRTMQCERVSLLDTDYWMAEQTFWRRGDIDRITIRMLGDCDDLGKAFLAADFPAAQRFIPKPDPKAGDSRFGVLRETLIPSSALAVRTEFRALTERRVAAVALALRLYAVDHDGALAAKLSELVPKYLTAFPTDPFAVDGRALGWIASSRVLVYSVGENGTDDGVAAKLSATDEVPDPWRSVDAVFELYRSR